MKFTLVKNLRQDPLMRPILIGLLIFFILYFTGDIFLVQNQFGSSYEALYKTYYGFEEEFIDSLSLQAILEYTHQKVFFVMMSLLTLSAVYIRVNFKSAFMIVILNITLLSAFLTQLLFILSFYYELLIFYYIVFYMWHIMALYMSIISLYRIVK